MKNCLINKNKHTQNCLNLLIYISFVGVLFVIKKNAGTKMIKIECELYKMDKMQMPLYI